MGIFTVIIPTAPPVYFRILDTNLTHFPHLLPISSTMTSEEVATAPSTAKKAPAAPKAVKSAVKTKRIAEHPPYPAMIIEAIQTMKDRNGSSRPAILKYIVANNKVDANRAQDRVRQFIKKLVAAKKIVPGSSVPGRKGSGCFKVVSVEKKPVMKKMVKKPVAKKVPKKTAASKKTAATKKSSVQKKTAPKKSAAKKTPAKKTKAAVMRAPSSKK